LQNRSEKHRKTRSVLKIFLLQLFHDPTKKYCYSFWVVHLVYSLVSTCHSSWMQGPKGRAADRQTWSLCFFCQVGGSKIQDPSD